MYGCTESWMGRSSFAESSVGVVMWCHVAASRPWCPREECGGHHGSVGSVKSWWPMGLAGAAPARSVTPARRRAVR